MNWFKKLKHSTEEIELIEIEDVLRDTPGKYEVYNVIQDGSNIIVFFVFYDDQGRQIPECLSVDIKDLSNDKQLLDDFIRENIEKTIENSLTVKINFIKSIKGNVNTIILRGKISNELV